MLEQLEDGKNASEIGPARLLVANAEWALYTARRPYLTGTRWGIPRLQEISAYVTTLSTYK